jgi:hypothetical protein
MSEEVTLYLRPKTINPAVDTLSDTTYKFIVKDASETPVDFTGYTARMQVRPYKGATALYDELTTENGRLELDAEGGITIRFPAGVTAEFTFRRAVYDIIVTAPNESQYRVAEGVVMFNKGVTV